MVGTLSRVAWTVLLVLSLGWCSGARAATPVITEFSAGITPSSGLQGIALGPDGNMWFTEFGASKIGRITPAGAVTEFPLAPGAMPYDIAAGHDGNLWFTQFGDDKLGRITTAGTVLAPVPLVAGADPIGITSDRQGRIWATEQGPDQLALFTPPSTLAESGAGITAASDPRGITTGSDGAVWFTEDSGKLGRRSLSSSLATEITVSSGDAIATSPDGGLWFTRPSAGNFAAYFPNNGGAVVLSGLPSSGSMPFDVAPGPDGRMWMTELAGNRIAAIRSDFTGEEFDAGITAGSNPFGIAAGADGAMWFTEVAGRIGRITTGEDPYAFTAPAPLTFGASSGGASTYPSSIPVAGLTGTVTSVRVRLNGLFAQRPENFAALLVDPGGRSVLLFNGVGGAADADGAVMTFADDGTTLDAFTSGRYVPREKSISGGDLPAPAPAGPHGASLSVFNGTDPNGEWRLFLARRLFNTGTDLLVGGWSLDIRTVPPQTVAVPGPTQTVAVPVPGPAVAAPPDTRRAALRLSGVPSRTTLAKLRKGFSLTVTPDEPVSLDVSLTARQTRATPAAVRVALFERTLGVSGAKRTVRVRPAKRSLGAPRKAFRLRLRVVATDRGGNRTTVNRTIAVSTKR